MTITINGTTGVAGVDGSASTPAVQGTDSNTGISFGSDILAFNTGGTERSRFDSNGNLLIGNTSFNAGAFGGTAKGINVAGTQPLVLLHETDTDKDGYLGMASSQMRLTTADSIPITFATADTERMRVTSGGKFYVGTTNGAFANDAAQHSAIVNSTANEYTLSLRNNVNSSDGRGLLIAAGNGSGGERLIFFERYDGHTLGSITVAGHSSVAYNTSSDYRLKENVVTLSDGITRLKTLKPSRFNFKENSSRTVDGFLAHEVTAVPEAITGTKDEVDEDNNPIYQGIDQSKLVPLLTAALQEAVAKIEVLETKVAALEAA